MITVCGNRVRQVERIEELGFRLGLLREGILIETVNGTTTALESPDDLMDFISEVVCRKAGSYISDCNGLPLGMLCNGNAILQDLERRLAREEERVDVCNVPFRDMISRRLSSLGRSSRRSSLLHHVLLVV